MEYFGLIVRFRIAKFWMGSDGNMDHIFLRLVKGMFTANSWWPGRFFGAARKSHQNSWDFSRGRGRRGGGARSENYRQLGRRTLSGSSAVRGGENTLSGGPRKTIRSGVFRRENSIRKNLALRPRRNPSSVAAANPLWRWSVPSADDSDRGLSVLFALFRRFIAEAGKATKIRFRPLSGVRNLCSFAHSPGMLCLDSEAKPKTLRV